MEGRDLLLTICVAPILLVLSSGCKQGLGDSSGAETPPVHPWDWEPGDSELAAGKSVYLSECALCHNEGENGAPRLGSKRKWEERIARGIPSLVENAIDGTIGPDGEMPPKGDSPHLTDEEVTAAVRFMVAAPKK